ncbi:MAG TPA: DUF2125 domain-containing protein [Kiloniellaceae bacterium]|nr:DUF2125 domain-containing protein [Kiloniellaceae bacterium]
MRRNRLVSLGTVALAVFALAVSAYWYWASEALAEGIARWRAEQIERGYEIDYDGPHMGGFPFALTVTFNQPKAVSPQGLSWQGPPIRGAAKLWDPFTIDLEFPGTHQLRLAEGQEEQAADVATQEARGQVVLALDGQVDSASVDLGALRVNGPDLRPLTVDRLTARLGPLRQSQNGDPDELNLAGEAVSVSLPDGEGGPLGDSLERLSFRSTVVGGIPRGKPAESLPQWRDAGGLWRFESLSALWGPLDLQAKGRLGLDQALRPAGLFDTQLKGADEIIERLVEDGRIKPEAAFAAQLAVAAMGRRDAASGTTVLEAPITLRDGLLFLGPVPLFPIAPVL